MARKKAPRPGRLPATRSKSDGTGNIVALAAFEVRLAQADQGFGPFGRDDDDFNQSLLDAKSRGRYRKPDWLIEDDHEDVVVLDHSDQEDQDFPGIAAADGAEAITSRKSPYELSYKPANKTLITCDEPWDGNKDISLAVVELDFQKQAGSHLVKVPHESSKNSVDYGAESDGPLELYLARAEKGADVLLCVFRSGVERVSGPASYWMGASEDELEALRNLIVSGRLRIYCRTSQRGDHDVLQYKICLNKNIVHSSLLAAAQSSSPTFQTLTWSIRHMAIVFEWLFPGSVSTTVAFPDALLKLKPSTQKFAVATHGLVIDPTDLFSEIRPRQDRTGIETKYLPSGLTVVLRPYQRRAVRWMLEHEGALTIHSSDRLRRGSMFAPFFGYYMSADGLSLQFCPFNASVCCRDGHEQTSIDPKQIEWDADNYQSGGILADEMGLGKTVEVISLVLSHPASTSKLPVSVDPFQTNPGPPLHEDNEEIQCICNHSDVDLPGGTIQCHYCGNWQHVLCSLLYERSDEVNPEAGAGSLSEQIHVCISCRATRNVDHPAVKGTLIVCPVSIGAQWLSEIDKHTNAGTLKVMMYNGARNIAGSMDRALNAVIRAFTKVKKGRGDLASLNAQLLSSIRTYEAMIAPLWPQHLAKFDVVVTTYNVLRSEVHHVQTAEKQAGSRRFTFRQRKKYQAAASPLTSVKWFRVCLDEAQEVESSAAAAAEMAQNLRAHFRWCITGTPVGNHGLEDLFGLLLFLRVPVLSDRAWWNTAIVQPLIQRSHGAFARLVAAFHGLLWRNTKRDVQAELGLPSLTEHIHRLKFTAIESHFYNNQHAAVARLAAEAPAGALGRKRKSRLETALPHLLRLRQACCHPQIGSFGLRDAQGGRHRRKKARRHEGMPSGESDMAALTERGRSADAPMTMSEIYQQLVNKAKLETEEAQRLLLMNLNASAGIFLIKEDWEKARETYQRALNLMTKHEKDNICKTDSLQRLHTLEALRHISADQPTSEENLGTTNSVQTTTAAADEVNSAIGNAGSDTSSGTKMIAPPGNQLMKQLHLDRMGKEIKDIRDRFMLRYEVDVKSSLNNFQSRMEPVHGSPKHCESWWIRAIHAIEGAVDGASRSNILIDRIRMDKTSGGALISSNRQDSLVWQFGDLFGLRMVLQREIEKLNQAHAKVEQATSKMGDRPTAREIHESAECSVCRYYFSKTGPMCSHCHIKRDIVAFEKCLFTFQRESSLQDSFGDAEGDARLYQFRHDSEMVLILRILKTTTKSLHNVTGLAAILDDADKHMNKLEALSSELSAAWDVWQKRDQWLKAFDELEMATMRMRLQFPGETIEADEEQWKIRPELVEVRLEAYELECVRYRSELNQCISQLKYLDSIKGEENGTSRENGQRLGTTTKTRMDGGEENECCPICHDPFGSEFAMLLCGHTLCVTCVQKLFKFSNKCPNCRAKFQKTDVRYVTRREDVRQASGSDAGGSLSSLTTCAEGNTLDTRLMKKRGFGTKFDAVVEELLRVEAASSDEKCLVFSQWEEVLAILEHALRANDISHVRIQGRAKYDERLSLFRRDPSVRVMLMNLTFGSRGLNVTEASHVFLVEPIMNPAIEAQAIGRIHRIGQAKPTHVHRFLVCDTVEERIHKMFRRKRLEALHDEDDHHEEPQQSESDNSKANVRADLARALDVEAGEQTHELVDQEYKTEAILSNEREQISEQELEELFS